MSDASTRWTLARVASGALAGLVGYAVLDPRAGVVGGAIGVSLIAVGLWLIVGDFDG